MKAIEERGLQLAAKFKIFQKEDGTWSVPSQAGKGRYVIEMGDSPRCSCAYHETHGSTCKHIYAVNYFLQRDVHSDGSETITETVTVSETTKRKTYPQNWTAYNAAQTSEKFEFQRLLHSLCTGLEAPVQTNGRPRLPICDAVFSVVFKVYSAVSGRRFMSDLTDAHTKGYIGKVPHFNSIFNYLEQPEMTDLLAGLITESSLPLRALEDTFAVDSTGFGTTGFTNWYSTKYGEVKDQHGWVKTHICCGVRTNVVAAVRISERYAHDGPLFPELVRDTAANFDVRNVIADKGYSSKNNVSVVEEVGANPYIAFKKTANPNRPPKNDAWVRMYHLYSYRREEFLEQYHQRSNVESTFMAIKAKFGNSVRSKTPVAQGNEVLCKILCHNICCVVQSMYEVGIEVEFGKAA